MPAFASIYTGHIPARHGAGTKPPGAKKWLGFDANLPTLAEALHKEGYATGAVVNNPVLKPRFGLKRGFHFYDYQGSSNRQCRRADKTVDAALSWAAKQKGRFFLTLHIFDPHLTYDPPPSVAGRFTAELKSSLSLPIKAPKRVRRRVDQLSADDRRFIIAAYDEEIAFVDQEVSRLLATLFAQKQDLFVILTSDHGEEFFDHGGFEHGHTHYQELLRVPLLMWGPGVAPGRVKEAVSLIDIAPTILDALGAEADLGDALGRSFWSLARGEPQTSSRALVAETMLYGEQIRSLLEWPLKVIDAGDDDGLKLFDLERDPMEERDLAAPRAKDAKRLSARLRELVRAGSAASQAKTMLLDEEMSRALETLGYVE